MPSPSRRAVIASLRFLLVFLAGAVAGWIVRGTRALESEYGALGGTRSACRAPATRADTAMGALVASVLPPGGPSEMPAASSFVLRRELGSAELTVIRYGVDDEVTAEGRRWRLAWDSAGGWRATACESTVARR